MKKLLLLTISLMLSVSMFAQDNSTTYTGSVPSVPGVYQATHNGDPANVLLIRDYLAWGYNVNVPILTGLGATVTVISSAQIASHDFSPYCLIVVEGAQYDQTLINIQANNVKFESFVSAGGIMEIHACLYGENLTLPGGVQSIYRIGDPNVVTTPAHPIVAGVQSPFASNYASHNYFTNLLPGTTIITEDLVGSPTTIEYTLGNGLITATGCTYEWANGNGYPAGVMLNNNLAYSVLNCKAPDNNTVPLSPWAIAIALVLILGTTVLRFRRIL